MTDLKFQHVIALSLCPGAVATLKFNLHSEGQVEKGIFQMALHLRYLYLEQEIEPLGPFLHL